MRRTAPHSTVAPQNTLRILEACMPVPPRRVTAMRCCERQLWVNCQNCRGCMHVCAECWSVKRYTLVSDASAERTETVRLLFALSAPVQVLVVANPANTNALILKENAPSIPAENITCLTRLDHNRALGQVRTSLIRTSSDFKKPVMPGI